MIDLGRGLMLEDATQADLDYVHENLRTGDGAEHLLDEKGEDMLENMPGVMVVKQDGKIIGYIGAIELPYETVLSSRRYIYYLSTDNADKIKLTYVKRSRDVLKAYVDARVPAFVDELYVATLPKEYPMASKWLERVLGFKKLTEKKYRGKLHRIYFKPRKEI